MRLGVRQKLFLSIGLIAALAVISSLVSFTFFGHVLGVLRSVTQHSVPAVSAALTLAAQSADLAATAPTLAYASGEGERKMALGELQAKLVQIDRTLALVKASNAPADIREEVESSVVRLTDSMQRINDAVTGRLKLAGDRQEQAKPLNDNDANFVFLTRPASDHAVSSLRVARLAASSLADAVDQLVMVVSEQADNSTSASMTAVNIAQTSMAIIAAICLISAVVIGWLYIGRRVIDPIVATTGTMDRLAKRDWQAEVTGVDRTDEIGDMARAVQVFKDQGQEADKLQSQIEADRERFETERKAQEALLKSAVGEIVGAANAGDLSQRIDTAKIDGVMRELGQDVNRLLGTVDRALGDLGTMLHKLADGDLTHRIGGDYQGIFSRLAGDANQVSDRLAGTMKQLASAAALVRDASAEISTGSQDLAQRTESQAASIEETAASMHEITTTVKQNADNAQAANQLATAARDTAEKGGSVVGDAVEAVTRIEESAQKISDIVGLIDEIAFQTNLLALNASVEAARAGEAGKGFAVVAQEVRALAQRSANASKDIKALIQESNAQVKTGADLVGRTGQSLTEIVASIKKVSDIVAEIAAASREQATGLEQINTAVGQMDEMTQRNGALVEQTSASAQALADQARQLAELVGFFRLIDTHGSPMSTAIEASAQLNPEMLAMPAPRKPFTVLKSTQNPQLNPPPQVVKDNKEWNEF